jgi:hypothetical protein
VKQLPPERIFLVICVDGEVHFDDGDSDWFHGGWSLEDVKRELPKRDVCACGPHRAVEYRPVEKKS